MFSHSSSFWRIEGFTSASRINTPHQGNWTSLLINKPQGRVIRYLSKGQMRCSQHFGCQAWLVPEPIRRSNKHCRKQKTSGMIWAGFKALSLWSDSERHICTKYPHFKPPVNIWRIGNETQKSTDSLGFKHWRFRIGDWPDLQSESVSV